MRLVFFTAAGYETDELFSYIFAHVTAVFPDSHIVAVRSSSRNTFSRRLRRLAKIVRQRGVVSTVEMISSKPIQWLVARHDARAIEHELRSLPRPPASPSRSTTYVTTVNGPDAIAALEALRPDVILQTGAGILRAETFQIARLGSINMHHGVAPLIRGVNSMYWALYENKPEWLGATIHRIDAGIDTGTVLAYAPLGERAIGEGFPSLFARATEAGTAQLVDVLSRLAAGESWSVPSNCGRSEYRSSISGWRLGLIELKLWRERKRAGRLSGRQHNSLPIHTNAH